MLGQKWTKGSMGTWFSETYEKKVGGLVPQPPGWTNLHPHSISKLRKVHKNSGKLSGQGARQDRSLASGLCEQKLG